jgi:hypothetical protein
MHETHTLFVILADLEQFVNIVLAKSLLNNDCGTLYNVSR